MTLAMPLNDAEPSAAWQQQMRGRFPAQVYARGFSAYKKPIVRRFFQGSRIVFDYPADKIPENATLVVWGRHAVSEQEVARYQIVRLEDGFIRSVGLGADLIAPLSWAMDRRGIYYDATRPSDLEHLLQNHRFEPELLVRTMALRERLVAAGLTKYNVGSKAWQPPLGSRRPIILVPGQVESDASLALGAPAICTNIGLLAAVRGANPMAYIIYKPHPDVVAGLRDQGQGEDATTQWCDEVVVDAVMGKLLEQVDQVHTLTSLAGFEALLRGKKVVCYGLPFYAGWGLTHDVLPLARRTRRLALDELVAGALILYPTYISRTTGEFTTPERALDELLAWRDSASSLPWWRKVLRGFLKLEIMLKAHVNNRR
jgi:capsular polysaccharide export protein